MKISCIYVFIHLIFVCIALYVGFGIHVYLRAKHQVPTNITFPIQVPNEHESAPNIIHFAFISGDSAKDMLYFEYLAIKAAKVNGKADKVIVHYDKYQPTGKWSMEAQKYASEFRQSPYDLTTIFGNPVNVLEHRKDVLELFVLRDIGGIFIDLDMFILKPVQDLLDNNVTILRTTNNAAFTCGFLEAKPASPFIIKWIEEYKSFDDTNWNQHCNKIPIELYKIYSEQTSILERETVLIPNFFDVGHRKMFYDRTHDYKANYAAHLWYPVSGKPYAQALSTKLIWSVETSLFCQLRNLTADEEDAGVWTEEMSKDCAIVNLEGAKSRVKGLIGDWPLENVQETMPKVNDLSGNRMHGILSPLNQYKPAGTDFNKEFFIFNRGDHIFLPMLPEANASSFTLTLRFRVNKNPSTKNATLLSILLNDKSELNVFIHQNCLSLSIVDGAEHAAGTAVGNSSICLPDMTQWYDLKVMGNNGNFILNVNNENVEITKVQKHIMLSILHAVWLGRRNTGKLHRFQHPTDIPNGSQMALVKLYDHPLNLDSN